MCYLEWKFGWEERVACSSGGSHSLDGAGAASQKVTELNKLNAMIGKCLKRIWGLTRVDRLGSEEMRRKLSADKQIKDRVKWKILKWLGPCL